MLDDYKHIFEEKANNINNWKNLSRSELCNLYLEEKDKELANSYLSAIICKFWNVAVHNYYSLNNKEVKDIDCYNNLIDSILYALESKVWLEPNNKLYNDPKGPEKAINVVLSSRKLNIYAYNNMYKRRLNKESLSLEYLKELPTYFGELKTEDKCGDNFISNKIKYFFNRKEYLKAFVIDAIINCDVFDIDNNNYAFSEKKLRKHLRDLIDNNYHIIFSDLYEIPTEKVERAATYIVNTNQEILSANIKKFILSLRQDKIFLRYLKDK